MAQINNLHATVADKPILKGLSLALAALLLAGCGDFADTKDAARDVAGSIKNDALAKINTDQLAANLPPEARAVVTSYKADLKAAASAHIAQFGQLPANLADLASVAGAREVAVNMLADGLGEQIPFASRETLEKAANGLITTAETQVLAQMKVHNAPNN